MAFREVRDEAGKLVCLFDPKSLIISVKRKGQADPLRADLTPYLHRVDCTCQESTDEYRGERH